MTQSRRERSRQSLDRAGSAVRAEPEHGSAIAEFVMVAGLLLFVALAVFQLGLALYVRNTVVAAASEGARYGARADATPADGAARTTSIITSSLSASYAKQVSAARRTGDTGVTVVEVTVTAPVPVIGPIGPAGAMVVTGRAFSEIQALGGAP